MQSSSETVVSEFNNFQSSSTKNTTDSATESSSEEIISTDDYPNKPSSNITLHTNERFLPAAGVDEHVGNTPEEIREENIICKIELPCEEPCNVSDTVLPVVIKIESPDETDECLDSSREYSDEGTFPFVAVDSIKSEDSFSVKSEFIDVDSASVVGSSLQGCNASENNGFTLSEDNGSGDSEDSVENNRMDGTSEVTFLDEEYRRDIKSEEDNSEEQQLEDVASHRLNNVLRLNQMKSKLKLLIAAGSLREMCGVHAKDSSRGSFLCSKCGRMFTTKGHLNLHSRIHSNTKKFPCRKCRKKFRTKSQACAHMKFYCDKQQFTCIYCDKIFRDRIAMEGHIYMHIQDPKDATSKEVYFCDDCGRIFGSKSSIALHMKTHAGIGPYACSYCDVVFYDRLKFVLHIRTHRS